MRITHKQLRQIISEELSRATDELVIETSIPGLDNDMIAQLTKLLGEKLDDLAEEVGPQVLDICGGMLGILGNPGCVVDALVQVLPTVNWLDEDTLAAILEILSPATA